MATKSKTTCEATTADGSKCRNTTQVGSRYCWIPAHQMSGRSQEMPSNLDIRPVVKFTNVGKYLESSLYKNTGLSLKQARQVVRAIRVIAKGLNLAVPSVAREHYDVKGFVKALVAEGVKPSDISVWKLKGLTTRTYNGEMRYMPNAEHFVVILNHNSENKDNAVVVDPFPAAFVSISDKQYENMDVQEASPFLTSRADVPLVMHPASYIKNSEFSWSHSTRMGKK